MDPMKTNQFTKPQFSVHPEGIKFGLIFAAIAFLLWHCHHFLGYLGALLTGWCFYFFRNPNRITPLKSGLVISPADGIVSQIIEVVPTLETGLPPELHTRISIFMNVFNVHVNRIPIEGKLTYLYYHAGKFLNASLDKASEHNERQCFIVETKNHIKIGFVQIAGLVARRIRCDVVKGQEVMTGQRFGLIRFGSRVDVYLPKGIAPLVMEGQIMIAGETVLADLGSAEPARLGVIR